MADKGNISLTDVFICIYCGNGLKKQDSGLICPQCGEFFNKTGKVWNFLDKKFYNAGSADKETAQKLKEIEVFEDVESYNELMSRPYLRALKEDVLRRLHPQIYKNKNILELGAGRSLFLEEFPHNNFIVISDINIELLKQNTREDANYVAFDAEKIPFKSGTFDLVYMMGVLHHLPNPRQSLREVKRVLKDGGVVLINEPTKWSMNLIYYLIRRFLLLVMGERFLKKLIGCGTPYESFVDMKQAYEVFSPKEYRISNWYSLPLRMPPLKLIDKWAGPVKFSRLLEKLPVINKAGTIVSMEIMKK